MNESDKKLITEWLNSRTESGGFRLCQLVAEWLTAQKEGENGIT
jgi:hypothetical protein